MPKPTVVGLPYEDVTLTTPDNLKIKAYVIPARKHFVSTVELQQMGKEERKKRMDEEIEDWAEEMGKEDAAEVSETQSAPDRDNHGLVLSGLQADTAKYARSRPTVIIFHANAGMCSVITPSRTIVGALIRSRQHGPPSASGAQVQRRQ